jgi:phosphoglycerol transferase MdoB-like AlkP superfamily enzyme
MLFLQRIPKTIKWIFCIVSTLLICMSIGRFIFYANYNPTGKAASGSAFIMGLRFDARIACIIGLIMLLLCALPFLHPFKNNKAIKFWNILLPLIFVVLVVVYAIDFYHYDYLHQRLNASVLNYLQDAGISYQMMWQTYPLLKITLAIIVIAILARLFFGWLLNKFVFVHSSYKRTGALLYVAIFLIFAQIIVGKMIIKPGQFPLRWSDAFILSDDFKGNLSLNPLQSFFSTLSFRKSSYDIKTVKQYYPMLAAQLGLAAGDTTTLSFERNYTNHNQSTNQPNIVLVICESFSAYKSSMYNNALNTTPYFAEMCKNGIFFNRCFTPAYGTARGVWATITGIPDVEDPGTASRNPSAVDQHTIINDFKNYNRYYFLGGSANWANIRGVLTNNINNLKLYEEERYKATAIDVWGISDKNLFLEANNVLKTENKPFFAVIQTADNHRPYTIPEEDKAQFRLQQFSIDTLKKYGFDSNEEMNAFRYTDFCFKTFIEAAQREKYFDNTIFVFIGDHGIRYSDILNYLPKAYAAQGLTCQHVPLLFYAPKLIQPQIDNRICSQIDVLPSIAGLVKLPYTNTTLGRNLFNSDSNTTKNHAFIIDHDTKTIGVINDDYYFLKNTKTGKEEMVSVINDISIPINLVTDSIKNSLRNYSNAYYTTARYMLFNNKKKQ